MASHSWNSIRIIQQTINSPCFCISSQGLGLADLGSSFFQHRHCETPTFLFSPSFPNLKGWPASHSSSPSNITTKVSPFKSQKQHLCLFSVSRLLICSSQEDEGVFDVGNKGKKLEERQVSHVLKHCSALTFLRSPHHCQGSCESFK